MPASTPPAMQPHLGEAGTTVVVGVGGFLGAGKTTTILAAVRELQASGRRVAVVTNDQASGLADTALARTVAGQVAEIAGGCFCCRYDALEATLATLLDGVRPDVVLAEAVGSCTDLAATVYQPLLQQGRLPVHLGPLSVVVDGRRLVDALTASVTDPAMGGDDVAYLYGRQLAEADVLLLNKVDLLTPDERAQATAALAATCPEAAILPVIATTGQGVAEWTARLAATAGAGRRVLDLDYDRYAAAEASLGWLNLEGTLTTNGVPATTWLTGVLEGVQRRARAAGAVIAHVKLWLGPPGAPAAAGPWTARGTAGGNAVDNAHPPLVWSLGEVGPQARVLVNARVAAGPDVLRRWIEQALAEASARAGTTFAVAGVSAFRPARPVPLFRLHPR